MSLYKSLLQYTNGNPLPLHMPGHKRNPAFEQPSFAADITEVDAFCSLYEERGPLADLSLRVQNLYHSKKSYLLVNGSTVGILTSIRSATKRGDTVLMARNCHCSVYHATRLFGLHAQYLVPEYDAFGIAHGFRTEQIKAAVAKTKPALVILTSPTYEGLLSEIKEIASFLHKHNIPLLVDEAHGAHLDLHPSFPGGAVAAGADLVVQSLHKTLPSLTQTAVLHLNGTLIFEERVSTNLKMLQTSSPSFLLLSSIDLCISALETSSGPLFTDLCGSLEYFYTRTASMKVLTAEQLPATEKDATRIIIKTPAGFSGKQLADILKEQFNIELEAAAPGYITAITGIADTRETFERFADALLSIDDLLTRKTADFSPLRKDFFSVLHTLPEAVFDSCSCENLPCEYLPYADCAGRISAEYLYLYPPGIPVLVPGERVSASMLDYIYSLTRAEFRFSGPSRAEQQQLAVLSSE